eukprot:jgi/Mesen1/5303/ME000264S04329
MEQQVDTDGSPGVPGDFATERCGKVMDSVHVAEIQTVVAIVGHKQEQGGGVLAGGAGLGVSNKRPFEEELDEEELFRRQRISMQVENVKTVAKKPPQGRRTAKSEGGQSLMETGNESSVHSMETSSPLALPPVFRTQSSVDAPSCNNEEGVEKGSEAGKESEMVTQAGGEDDGAERKAQSEDESNAGRVAVADSHEHVPSVPAATCEGEKPESPAGVEQGPPKKKAKKKEPKEAGAEGGEGKRRAKSGKSLYAGDEPGACPSSSEEKQALLLQALTGLAEKMPKNAHTHFFLGLMQQRSQQPRLAATAFGRAAEILRKGCSSSSSSPPRPQLLAQVLTHLAQCQLQLQMSATSSAAAPAAAAPAAPAAADDDDEHPTAAAAGAPYAPPTDQAAAPAAAAAAANSERDREGGGDGDEGKDEQCPPSVPRVASSDRESHFGPTPAASAAGGGEAGMDAVLSTLKEAALADASQPAIWNNLALILLQAGRYASAVTVLTAVLSAMPGDLDTLANLGSAYLHIGQAENAIWCLQAVLEQDPSHAAALSAYGVLLLLRFHCTAVGGNVELFHLTTGGARGQAFAPMAQTAVEAAQRCLEAAVAQHPHAPHLWANLGSAYAAARKHDLATRCIAHAARMEPGNDVLQLCSAVQRVRHAEHSPAAAADRVGARAGDKLDSAAQELAKLVERHSSSSSSSGSGRGSDEEECVVPPAMAWAALAHAHRAQHEEAAAAAAAAPGGGSGAAQQQEQLLSTLQHAIDDNPGDPVAWHQLGLHMLTSLHLGTALTYLTAATVRRRSSAAAWSNLALVAHLSEESAGQAESVYKQALMLVPPHQAHGVLSNLGNLYRQQRRFREAHMALKQALGICPNYAPALNNLGLLLVVQGYWAEALGAFDKALDADPGMDAAKSNRMKAVALAAKHDVAPPIEPSFGAAPTTAAGGGDNGSHSQQLKPTAPPSVATTMTAMATFATAAALGLEPSAAASAHLQHHSPASSPAGHGHNLAPNPASAPSPSPTRSVHGHLQSSGASRGFSAPGGSLSAPARQELPLVMGAHYVPRGPPRGLSPRPSLSKKPHSEPFPLPSIS